MCSSDLLKEPLACKQKMAYVPDNPQLDEYMTGLQYINFICDIYEVPSKMRKQNFEKLALAFQMGPHLNNLISSYSHGMKQKLALIAAFSHTPKLLILDEPFVGLDPEAFVILKEQMKELCASGNSVLFSSHILDVVFGKIIATDNKQNTNKNIPISILHGLGRKQYGDRKSVV